MANKEHFKISAAVVKQLGEELVSDELTAIMELVKNSYDADADWVKITINTTSTPDDVNLKFQNSKGYISIEDNGHGMSYDDIINRWLFISLSHKREMKKNNMLTKKGRTPLGDKGLGRLSTQRLGNVIEIITCIESERIFHHVGFDWRHFTEFSTLEEVNTNYSEWPKANKNKGTKLLISDLKNPNIWLGESADKFRAELSKLIFPFKEKRPFQIFLSINDQSFDLDEINEKLRSQAVSRYQFHFDGKRVFLNGTLKLAKLQGNSPEKKQIYANLIDSDQGHNFYQFLSNETLNKSHFIPNLKYVGKDGVFIEFEKIFDFDKDIKPELLFNEQLNEIEFANPGKFFGEIDDFNISGTEEIESAYENLSEYKQLVKNQTGVRIFRDGFGIKPYGMGNDEWLQLRKSQTSGGSFYLLRPDNVIGFVSITAKENSHLVEKTDREGFIDSAYSKAFFNIIHNIINSINRVLEKTRRSYDKFKQLEGETKGNIKSFSDTKSRLLKTASDSHTLEAETIPIQNNLILTRNKVKDSIHRIKNDSLFSSEEERNLLEILEEVEGILDSSNSIFVKLNLIFESTKKLEADAYYLEPKINELENQIIQFSELAGLGLTAEAFTHEIYNIIDRIAVQNEHVAKITSKSKSTDTAVFTFIEQVKTFVNAIRIQLNHLAPSLKYNRETKHNITLSTFLKETQDYYKIKFGSKLKFDIRTTQDFTININKGRITQILDNLILNSEYWLKQISDTKKELDPTISIEIKSPTISVADNGYGIQPEFEQTLFQPFVTSKPKGEGRGLGLYLVQQLLEVSDSTIILLQKRNQYQRRYIFQINFNNILTK